MKKKKNRKICGSFSPPPWTQLCENIYTHPLWNSFKTPPVKPPRVRENTHRRKNVQNTLCLSEKGEHDWGLCKSTWAQKHIWITKHTLTCPPSCTSTTAYSNTVPYETHAEVKLFSVIAAYVPACTQTHTNTQFFVSSLLACRRCFRLNIQDYFVYVEHSSV